jgi:phosphoglucosamine mutase
MAKLFGTDGIRGEAGRFPLDAPTVRVIGNSLTRHLTERLGYAPRLVIGRDTRESGAWIEAAFVAGASEAGATCESAGVVTTPGVATLARILPADAGVVISASHNPYHDNGIKIFAPTGHKLDNATEKLIEADIAAADNSNAPARNDYQPDESRAAALRARYLLELRHATAKGLSLKGRKMVLDCANGAASHLAPDLFASLGADVIAINCAPDGRNINRDCGSLHLNVLQEKVKETGATFGVAFDGDADRSLFVDANSDIVDGDATLWALAQYLDARRELPGGLVVATVMSNIGLELALRSRGWTLTRTDVGDKYVLEELLKSGAAIGGEQSGHIMFPRLSLAGDGMMTTILLLQAMQITGKELHELAAGFTRYPQTLVNVRVKEKKEFSDVLAIVSAKAKIEKELGETGRLLLRYSGTEPLARVMIEGAEQKKIEEFAHELAAVIGAALSK